MRKEAWWESDRVEDLVMSGMMILLLASMAFLFGLGAYGLVYLVAALGAN